MTVKKKNQSLQQVKHRCGWLLFTFIDNRQRPTMGETTEAWF